MVLVSQRDLIKTAIDGGVVSFPTDTVPALAVIPGNSRLIYQLKQREASKPLILMGAKIEDFLPYLEGSPQEKAVWQGIMEKYWPGALTLVLPASEQLPSALNPLQDHTIGVRIPDLAIALEILEKTGPLATTSANLSGQPPLEKLGDITHSFPDVACLDCVSLEQNNPLGRGFPSTVAQWHGQTGEFKVLRQGEISLN